MNLTGISALFDLRDLKATGLLGPLAGHVGDGNFHMILLLDPESQKELSIAAEFCSRLARRAISMGGTCTGEHGERSKILFTVRPKNIRV